MADTSITFYGFWHLVGETVRASIAGLDCGTAVVQTDGSVLIAYGSDTGGLMTAAYLYTNTNALTGVENNQTFTVISDTSHSVTVPVVIGLDYTTQGQVLRPNVASDIHSPLGPGLGKTRRAYRMAAFVQDAIKMSYGTDFTTTLTATKFTTDGFTARAEDSPFTGVQWDWIKDAYSFDGMLCWQVNRPYPCTICSVSTFVEVEEP